MPKGTFTLYRVPLDISQQDTFYFENEQAQAAYFASKKVYPTNAAFESITYNRVTEKKIKIAAPRDIALFCNYIRIEDEDAPPVYAFIESAEYINDMTTIINYKVDVIQSFMFKWNLKPSMIERETVADDTPGLHTLPEPAGDDETIIRQLSRSNYFRAWSLVLLATFRIDPDQGIVDEYLDYRNGALTPLYPSVFNIITNVSPDTGLTIDQNELGRARATIEDQIKTQSSIDNIYKAFLFPTAFINLENQNIEIKQQLLSARPNNFTYNNRSYTPKNNKLLCYPYNFLEVDNGQNSINFKYEFMSAQPAFAFFSSLSPTPNILVKIYNNYNYTELESLTISEFPQIQFDKSILNEWLKNSGNIQANNLIYQAMNSTLSFIANPTGLTAGRSLLGNLQSYDNFNMTFKNMKRKGSTVVGSYNATISHALGLIDFFFKQIQIRPEAARVIDDFFQKYGYLVNELKTPSLKNRAGYTYIQTKGLNIEAPQVQQSFVEEIITLFNRGICFWNDISNFKNYNIFNNFLDND